MKSHRTQRTATPEDTASDDVSDDVGVIPIPAHLNGYLRNRINYYLTQTGTRTDGQFSAEILKIPGQNPRLHCCLGFKAAGSRETDAVAHGRDKATSTILVSNVPSSVDADFLEIFFESKKKQGGGPVRHLTLDEERHTAVVEFEDARSVETVMNKLPIKILDVTLQVQRHTPLLGEGESVDRMEISGLPTQLTDDIGKMILEGALNQLSGSSSVPQEFQSSQVPITREAVGSYEGKTVNRYSLKNKNSVEVRIIDYGGIIANIFTPDRDGHVEDIVLGFDTFEEYQKSTYFGGIMGRYANRIAGAQFMLDCVTYKLAKNRGQHHHIHGGPTGFHKRHWDSRIEDNKLLLSYISVDGEEGYPGKLWATVSYELTNKNKLVIRYTARTSKPTIVNLTSNIYFNLAGQDAGTLKDHLIRLAADKYLPMDWSCIPTGDITGVERTIYDLTKDTNLGARILEVPGKKGFDHTFCLEKPGWSKHAARVRHPNSGRVLDMYTTEAGIKLYTVHYIDGQAGKGGAIYRKYGGFTLEANNYPDSPNKPNFPSPVLRPGEEYQHVTVFKFSTENN